MALRRPCGCWQAAALAALALSCSSPRTTSQYALVQPSALALACVDGEKSLPLAECDDQGGELLALVANSTLGELAALELASGEPRDLDPTIPGLNGLFVGGYLADVAGRADSSLVYLLDSVGRRLVSVDPGRLEVVGEFALPELPGRLYRDEAGDRLLVTFPGASILAAVTLDEKGRPGELALAPMAARPSALAFMPDGTPVVAYLDAQFIDVLFADSLGLDGRIAIVPQCRDGLDDDEDGLVDRDDPDCLTPDQWREGAPAAVEPADEAEPAPECGNGVDDDEDGLIDLADSGCIDREDWSEGTDGARGPGDEELFPCANGRDDDGDGLVDYPDDPDCFAAGALTERATPAPAAELAVSPDGQLAYVLHRGLGTVVVVDLAAGLAVDINRLDDSVDRRLRARGGSYGIDFGAVPLMVDFQAREEKLYAFVADNGGMATRILVSEDGKPLHLVDSASEEDDLTGATKPRLQVAGEEVQMGYSPVPDHPNLGPLMVETIDADKGLKRYYGIDFTNEMRAHRSENWTVGYEQALPGSSSLRARIGQDGVVTILGGRLCRLGALPGDLFVFSPAGEECGEADGVTLNFPTAALADDHVQLDLAGGFTLDGSEAKAAELPGEACLEGLVEFSLRPAGIFTVVGSRTGFLHNVVASGDGCVEDGEGDPLFAGRAQLSLPAKGQSLASCPATRPEDGVKPQPFSNPIFSFTLYPPCSESLNGSISLLTPSRDAVWKFAVVPGFVGQTIIVAALPSDQLLAPGGEQLYLLDLAGRSLKTIALESFQLVAATY